MRVTTVDPALTHNEACGLTNNIHKSVVPTHLIYQNDDLDARYSEVGSFGRLHADLRNSVRRDMATLSARTILTTAVKHLHNARFARTGRISTQLLAFAFADLAVTGHRAYFGERTGDAPLSAIRDFDELTRAIIADVVRDVAGARETDVRSCANDIMRRVFRVAWTLLGPPEARARFRDELGWITVSGEDDSPYRPVNAPATPFPQYNVTVRLEAGSIGTIQEAGRPLALPLSQMDIRTRMVVATASRTPETVPASPTSLPPISAPRIPARVGTARDIIVFIHGHSSRAEEFEDIAPLVLGEAARRGRQLVMISLDMPCAGYSQMLDSETFLGTLDHSRNVDVSRASQSFPGLRFFEEFICRFIETLGIEDRVLAIIGGSLGGNMTLRLGRTREARRVRYVPNIISWSAASVWDSFAEPHDPIDEAAKTLALNNARDNLFATRTESVDPALADPARAAYFNNVFIDEALNLLVWRVRRQPEHWYREGWEPCKSIHIENAMLDRQEIYCRFFRQMHWRIAIEQLLFSQNLRESGRPLHAANLSRTFLLAGEGDNFDFTNIHDATRTLGGLMTTPGECVLVRETGHSIHNERPRWFTDQMLRFLGI